MTDSNPLNNNHVLSRKVKAQETKKILLESGIALFKEKGFDEVTIEEITLRAGTAKGTFYTHFSTKSDIIVEEFWTIDAYYRKYSRNLKNYKTSREKLSAFTRAQTRFIRDKIGNSMLKLFYANQTIQEGANKVILDESRFWFTIIRDIIQEGQDNGEFRKDLSTDTMARWFNRTMRGNFLDWCISSGKDFDLVEEAVAYCDMFICSALEKKEHYIRNAEV
jgi:AcrR family transcriptional regulator